MATKGKIKLLNLTVNQYDWSRDSKWDYWDFYNVELVRLSKEHRARLKQLEDSCFDHISKGTEDLADVLDYTACKIVELVDDISGGEPMATVITPGGFVTTRLVHALVNGGYTVNFPVFDRHSGTHINFVSADPMTGEG